MTEMEERIAKVLHTLRHSTLEQRAKAVLEEMRMPTKAMLFDVAGDLTVWQTMIDEAKRC